MTTQIPDVKMDWEHPDRVEAMTLFQQQCQMLFRIKKIKKEQQVDEILLRTGLTGLRKFNSWGLSEEDATKPEVVWAKFGMYGGPHNPRIARLELRTITQDR